jgi:hypothetical protein
MPHLLPNLAPEGIGRTATGAFVKENSRLTGQQTITL